MIRLPAERARDALLRALEPHAAPFAILATTSTDWASGLFTGARHRIAITLTGDDAQARATRLQRELPELELELEIRGGFVADVQVAARLEDAAPTLAIEALTIEDGVQRAGSLNAVVRRVG